MTEAWRPFTDEEMRKIIEGERLAVNGVKDDSTNTSVAKRMGNSRVMRGRPPFKRVMNGNRARASENGSDTCTQTHCDLKISSKTTLGLRIPKILEEKEEEEDEGCDLVEPVLRCESVEIQRCTSDTSGGELSPKRSNSVEIIVLEKFQEKQKVMEEQNRMSKELLERALCDRAKKTRQEAQKLNHIEEELKKLDNMLSNDVTIIRDQIEVASHQYLEAQKRYDRAEKEYIGAKMNLYTFKEKKELLTSHLCTIIEKNELRKAQKLSDLMRKLEMGMDISSLTLDVSDLKVSEDTTEGEGKESPT